MKSFIKSISYLIPVVVVSIILFGFIIKVSYVPTDSMLPYAGSHSLIINTRITGEIKRGDVVIFYHQDSKNALIKRVIGIWGDEIEFKNEKVYVNKKPLVEKMTIGKTLPKGKTKFKVPKDCFFLLGDNREYSYDSRYWKHPYIPKENIIGKSKISLTLKGKEKGIHLLKNEL